MADEKELRELCERIGRLGGRDQTRLLEMVLAENRRKCEEAETNLLREVEAQREGERQRLAAEGKRAAG
jgi:hypothetical protein